MLELRDLDANYGAVAALKSVSLKVDKGEIVTLIGANGAGKTTVLRCISGVHPTSGGRILFEGADLAGLKPGSIVRLGLTQSPEGRQIFPKMTVAENLLMGAYTRENDGNLAEDLHFVHGLFPILADRADQYGGTLSGGEQQMLAMGRAIMSRPKLLLLDEPSLGLAPLIVETIFETIVRLNQQGVTILLVEQNAHMALSIANRAYVLETGRIAMQGPASRLLHDPKVQSAYLGLD